MRLEKDRCPRISSNSSHPDVPGPLKLLRAAQTGHLLPIEEVELYGALVHVVAHQVKLHQRAIERELSKGGIQMRQRVRHRAFA